MAAEKNSSFFIIRMFFTKVRKYRINTDKGFFIKNVTLRKALRPIIKLSHFHLKNKMLMKNHFSLFALFASFLILFSGCDNMTVSTGDGSYKVTGNGKLSSEDRELASFDQIDMQGVFNVVLSQGDKQSVKVETDENILPMIITTVENNVLTVKMKDSTTINKMKKITVSITVANLSKITSEGVGSLKSSGVLKLKDLELVSKGVGASELNLSLDKLTVHSEIVGALILSGTAKEVIINHEGLGLIQAFDLKAEKLSLHSDGIGAAEVYASKELNIKSSGLGGVQYKGNPQIKNIKNEGLCKIEPAD